VHWLLPALLGATAGFSLFVFLRGDDGPLFSLELLAVSLLYGALLADLLAPRGWLAFLTMLPGAVAYFRLRRARRRSLLDVRLRPLRAVEAEALMELARRGQLPGSKKDVDH
jgi:hypothetical protein